MNASSHQSDVKSTDVSVEYVQIHNVMIGQGADARSESDRQATVNAELRTMIALGLIDQPKTPQE